MRTHKAESARVGRDDARLHAAWGSVSPPAVCYTRFDMKPRTKLAARVCKGTALGQVAAIGLLCCLFAGGNALKAQQGQGHSLGSINFGNADHSSHGTAERSLQGTVVDKNGTAVPGALVYLKEGGKTSVSLSVADAKGSYRFGPLARDTDYEVWAKVNGKASASKMISSFNSNDTIVLSLQVP